MTDNSAEQGTRWLSPEQLVEWKSLMGLLMIVPASLDAQLKQDAGLNLFEYHILVELAEVPERLRVMSELATQTRGSLSRLSHAVSRLEAAGGGGRRSCGGRAEAQGARARAGARGSPARDRRPAARPARGPGPGRPPDRRRGQP